MSERTCSIDGCDRAHYAHGWCENHYARWRRTGTTEDTRAKRAPVEVLFWQKVTKTDTCWLWTAALNSSGYGVFKLNGRREGAHRVAWLLAGRTLGPGDTIDHLCKTRNCVRVDHLRAISLAENIRASDSASGRNSRKTHCVNGHEFTPENTYRNGAGRSCRACAAELQRRRRAST